MKGDEAMELLGFAPNSRPNPSEVKAAYKRKVMESHPDLFPVHQKSQAETKFKQISEAYSCLKDFVCKAVRRPGCVPVPAITEDSFLSNASLCSVTNNLSKEYV